jgi:DNA-binding transcriptional ArsR family regulator
MTDELSPTLWRTCRTLASHRRLRLLARLFECKRACVEELAADCRLVDAEASQLLRQLQARGILSVQRRGRWVFYRPKANPKVKHAAAILAAMRKALHDSEGANDAIRDLTAYTHPRRINLVRAMAAGPADPAQLRAACSMSGPALYRHLDKLLRRGVVEGRRAAYRLSRPRQPLARTLLRIALAGD